MIKELLCQACANHYKSHSWFPFGAYSTQHKFVQGKSRFHLECDQCLCDIPKGKYLCCVTTYKDTEIYQEWEEEFVEREL